MNECSKAGASINSLVAITKWLAVSPVRQCAH